MVRVVFLLLFFTIGLFSVEWAKELEPVKPLESGLYVVNWGEYRTNLFVKPPTEGFKYSVVRISTYARRSDTLMVYYSGRGYYNNKDEIIINAIGAKTETAAGVFSWSPDSFKFILGGVNLVDITDDDGNGRTGKVRKVTSYGTKLFKSRFSEYLFDITGVL